jgi:hypothetical protein
MECKLNCMACEFGKVIEVDNNETVGQIYAKIECLRGWKNGRIDKRQA